MSHITKQIGAVKIMDLAKLARACSMVREVELGNAALKLDMNQKQCRYYGGRQQPCEGVITFDTQLTDQQKQVWYEMGLEKQTDESGKEFYAVLTDFHAADRGVQQRWERIQGAYRIEELKDQGIADGYVVAGQVEVAPGKFKLTLQKA